ncbi:hypothetical protein Tco_0004941, partial [Tanacetum coccineum]
LLKKHGLDEYVSMSTPMATERLDVDLQGTPTDQTTYRRMIGGLMYLTASRPDIAFATFVCARYQARPTVKHLKEMRTMNDKQDCTAMSTAEAEYVSLSAWCAQVIWMRTQLLDYGYKYNRIPMYCDSKSAIAISCNPVQHSKTKHIDIRYHFIKEHVEKGTVEIYFVGTEYQLADLFTKALPKERFEYLVHRIVIIMAQQQRAADVHPDELCPPNKRYDLMDANKKEDRSKYRLKFMLDKKELNLTLDDFKTIFHLPQATDNNHNSFIPPPSFSEMVPFYKQVLGFTMELKTPSSFKTTGLLQPWQTLCKIFSKCFDNTFTRWGYHAAIAYMQIFVLLCQQHSCGLCRVTMGRTLLFASSSNIFDSISKIYKDHRRHKDKVGMQIPAWMITDEMKHTEHYQMYAEVFGIDVPLTQSQPTESTHGMHRTTSRPLRLRRFYKNTLRVPWAEHKTTEEQVSKEKMWHWLMRLASEEEVKRGRWDGGRARRRGYIKTLPPMVDKHIKEQVYEAIPGSRFGIKFSNTAVQHYRDQDDPHDDAYPEGENSAKRQKTSEYEAYVSGESSSGQVFQEEQAPSTSGNQEQDDEI